MRKSALRLYAPLLALLAAQAMLVTLAPTVSTTRVDAGGAGSPTGGSALAGDGSGGADDGTGTPGAPGTVDPSTGETIPGSSGPASTVPGDLGGAGGGQATGSPAPGLPPGTKVDDLGIPLAGDRSHCSKAGSPAGPGQQFSDYYFTPPCQPKWPKGADNGGATYQGVTKDRITVVRYVSKPNAAVDGILRTFQLYTEPAEAERFQEEVMEPFINSRYELWGRKVDFVTVNGNCEYSPADIPCLTQEAKDIAAKHKPFAVIHPGGGTDAVSYDAWARLKIPSLGGTHYSEDYYIGRKPYRYDILMDGTRSVRNLADYYCKKLVGRPADHAGISIHASMPGGRRLPRKIGIMVPELPAVVNNGRLLQRLLQGERCGKAGDVPVLVEYASDISKAQPQATAAVQKLIANKVTSVICVCDPIAPLYFTKEADTQQYQPEHIMPGISLMDFDPIGRLYTPTQWTHAFGISHLYGFGDKSKTYEQTEWAATGHTGNVYENMGLVGGYERVFGWFLQQAGPNLTPQSMHRAMIEKGFSRGGWLETGRNPQAFKARWAPGDYTAWDDAKEVYWDPAGISGYDGKAGTYRVVDGGKRTNVMEWTPSDGVPYIPVKGV